MRLAPHQRAAAAALGDEEAEPQLFDDDEVFVRTQALITEICVTDIATSTGAMLATIDKYPGLTLEKFTAENVQVAVSVIMDPGMWFQDPGQGRRILKERGLNQLAEVHEESLLRLRLAAGGKTAGCNYRTHVGRTDPMCTVVGELQPLSIAALTFDDEDDEESQQSEGETAGADVVGADGVKPEPEPVPVPAPAPAPPPPPRIEEVGGAAALLRRLVAFETSDEETELTVRIKDATLALSCYRIRTTPDESGGLALDIPATIDAGKDWIATHPLPWVQTWDIVDDYEPPEGFDDEDPEVARRAVARAPSPTLTVRKTVVSHPSMMRSAGASYGRSRASGGGRGCGRGGSVPTVVTVNPDDFRIMLMLAS